MSFHLRVREPFGAYVRGQIISDPAAIETALGGWAKSVIKVAGEVSAETAALHAVPAQPKGT